jgi:hypothetical protein
MGEPLSILRPDFYQVVAIAPDLCREPLTGMVRRHKQGGDCQALDLSV